MINDKSDSLHCAALNPQQSPTHGVRIDFFTMPTTGDVPITMKLPSTLAEWSEYHTSPKLGVWEPLRAWLPSENLYVFDQKGGKRSPLHRSRSLEVSMERIAHIMATPKLRLNTGFVRVCLLIPFALTAFKEIKTLYRSNFGWTSCTR